MAAARSRWVLGVTLFGTLAAFLVALAMSGLTQADAPASRPVPAAGTFASPTQGEEVLGLRTANSRTFRKADGRYEARIWSQPVNYRNGEQWKAIDTDLTADGADGLKATATPAAVELPQSLDDPAKVSGGSRWVSFRLLGADGDVAPEADGSTATYADAVDDVDVRYDAKATGVKETLTLPDASAPATYRYAIDASSGLRPELRDNGTVVFRDGSGQTRFWLPAPTVQAHGQATPTTEHVSFRLSEDKQTLAVAVDAGWLAGASFPVRVDPTIYWGDDVSCTLADGTLQDTADCGGTTLKVGHNSGHTYRSVLRFPDLNDAIPRTASVDHAKLALYFEGQSDPDPDPLTVVAASGLVHTVAEGATWNMYDSVHGWDTPGGDAVSDPQAEWQWMVPNYEDGWVAWDISRLAESWLRDPATNNGVLLKATDENLNNVVTFDGHDWNHGGPNIAVTYEWHPGYETDQTYESVAFDGTSKISVNTATGSLAVDSTDISLPGLGGLDLKIRRTFNGQDLGDSTGLFGSGWTLSVNDAAFINGRTWWNDQRTLYLNGGAIYRFDRDYAHDTSTTYAYISPPNLNADLVSDDSGEATLTYRDTGISYTYAASWDGNSFALKKVSDTAGHHIDIAEVPGDPTRIGTITGSDGTVLTFHYGTNNKLTKITTSSTEWKYTTSIVNGYNRLTGHTNPANETTTYSYDDTALPDVWDKITAVHDTDGQDFTFDYGPEDWSQVTQITQDFGDSRPDSVTDFDYTPPTSNGHSCASSAFGRTVMTDDQNRRTTWCYDTTGHVTKAWRPWDTTAPIAGTPGALSGASGEYVSGNGQHTIALSATDTQSGVKRIALTEPGHGDWASTSSPCPPSTKLPQLCPASLAETLTVDTGPLTESAHTVRQDTTDLAGNTGSSPTWTVRVDRSAPTAPSGFDQSMFFPGDPNARVTITWNDATDPNLADGSPGSGVASYQVQYSINGGALSAWQPADGPNLTLTGVSVGNVITVNATATDAVGNVSAAGTANVTLVARDEDPLVQKMATDFIMDDLGITEAQATAYYDLQKRADGIGEAVGDSSSGPGYAGTWFDGATRQLVVNLKTGTSNSGAQAALSNAGLAAGSRIEYVTNTISELDDAFDQIGSDLNGLIAAELIQLNRDEANGRLVIEVGTDVTPMQHAQVDAAAASAPVNVVVHDSTAPNFQTVLDSCKLRPYAKGSETRPFCDTPLRGGVSITGYTADGHSSKGLCTAAFNVVSRTTGKPYVLTAGHCLGGFDNDSSRWTSSNTYDTSNDDGAAIATPVEIGPGHNPFINGDNGDAGLIAVNDDSEWWDTVDSEDKPAPEVFFQRNRSGLAAPARRQEHYRIRIAQTSYKNQTLCWSGATTGGHCGKVLNSSSQNARLGVLDSPKGNGNAPCIAGGDSGAPLVIGGQAHGILKGHIPLQRCHIYYQGVVALRTALNVQVITTAP